MTRLTAHHPARRAAETVCPAMTVCVPLVEFAVPSYRTEDAQKRRGKASRPDERPAPDGPAPEATV